MVRLEDAFELVLLVESVARRWSLGHSGMDALLFAVALPDPWLLGANPARLYRAPRAEPNKLVGLDARELLAEPLHAPPILDLDEPAWRFDALASGPLAERFAPVAPQLRVELQRLVSEELERLIASRAARSSLALRLPDAPAWRRCAICSDHHEAAFAIDAANAPTADPVAVRERYLTIVGAPHFTDRSDRGRCVKRCPLCGTHYLWESSYEYLVNGASESEESLSRLDAEGLERELAWVRAELAVRAPDAKP